MQGDDQTLRLRSLGIGVTPDAEVKQKFKITQENLLNQGFREKHRPLGFFSTVGLGILLFVSVVVSWNYIQLRHDLDTRSAEEILGIPDFRNATAQDIRDIKGLVDFVQLFHRVAGYRLAPSGEFAGEQVEVGLSFLIGSQYVLNRFLGDGAGVWSGQVYPEEEGDGINVFEDDEHQIITGEVDEKVSRSVPFVVTIQPSVLNSIPVTTASYSQDSRFFFRSLYEEVVCLHDDLCIGLGGFKMMGGIRNGFPFMLYRGESGHRPEKVYLHDSL